MHKKLQTVAAIRDKDQQKALLPDNGEAITGNKFNFTLSQASEQENDSFNYGVNQAVDKQLSPNFLEDPSTSLLHTKNECNLDDKCSYDKQTSKGCDTESKEKNPIEESNSPVIAGLISNSDASSGSNKSEHQSGSSVPNVCSSLTKSVDINSDAHTNDDNSLIGTISSNVETSLHVDCEMKQAHDSTNTENEVCDTNNDEQNLQCIESNIQSNSALSENQTIDQIEYHNFQNNSLENPSSVQNEEAANSSSSKAPGDLTSVMKDVETSDEKKSPLENMETSLRRSMRKRKRKLVLEDETDLRSEANKGHDTNPNLKKQNSSTPKKKFKKRKPVQHPVDPEMEKMLEGIEGEIDHILEETATKNRLTAVNVKNILRHVITNEYVLRMVRNTMKSEGGEFGEDTEEAFYEPKLTRSKAKELRERRADLPWPVSPLKVPKQCASKKLLEEEYSEEESTSDEEYEPVDEEETHSGDDDESVLSSQTTELGSPVVPISPSTPSSQTQDIFEDVSVPLTILLPPEPLPDVLPPSEDEPVDKIALRTRSKLPLNDTPLEFLEAAFVAPDITTDMYNTQCDDEEWKKFLSDFTKPLEVMIEVNEVEDDGEDDPEYNFLEEEDNLDAWDFRYDRAVKISKKELTELMAELLEAAEQELHEGDEEEEDSNKDASVISDVGASYSPSPSNANSSCVPSDSGSIFITSIERQQLDEQMRMHVQLLTQFYLLTKFNEELTSHNEASQLLLTELSGFANRSCAPNSAFSACNLNEAVQITTDVNTNCSSPMKKNPRPTRSTRKYPAQIPEQCRHILVHSPVFLYPKLLPQSGFINPSKMEKYKVMFTLAEDYLIAFGLEEFMPFEKTYVQLIKTHLVPIKTERQIHIRIKNVKSIKISSFNPIKYYFQHKKAPEVPRQINPFDPKAVCSPYGQPPDLLPNWMKPLLRKNAVPIAPSITCMSPSALSPLIFKTPEKKKYNILLPRPGNFSSRTHQKHISPLKHISPILKKYGHQRRLLPRMSYNLPTTPPKKVDDNSKQYRKPPLFKIQSIVNNEGTENSNVNYSAKNITNAMDDKYATVSNENKNINDSSEKSPSECNQVAIRDPVSLEANNGLQGLHSQSSECPDIFNNQPDNDLTGGNDSQNEMDTCEEVDGDGEEDALDNEQDLAALMAASTTICKKQLHPIIKKKNRQLKELESTLPLLAPNIFMTDPKKDEKELVFAQSYVMRVKEALKDNPVTFHSFLRKLCEFDCQQKTAINLYEELGTVLKDHPALIDDFVGFLLPEQAKQCGKLAEYNNLNKIRIFLRKLEINFINQPQCIQRILRTLCQLQRQLNLTSSAIRSALQPLLRNQNHLFEEFLQLLPDEPPPESLMTEFEEVTIPETDVDNTSDDSIEEITVPEIEDSFGGKQCPCHCHEDTNDLRIQNRNRHCIQCGTKFLDGKLYIQTGKVLKPAQFIYRTDVGTESNNKPLEATQTIDVAQVGSPVSPQGSESPLSSLTPSPVTLNNHGEEELLEYPETEVINSTSQPTILRSLNASLSDNITHQDVLVEPSTCLQNTPKIISNPPVTVNNTQVASSELLRSDHPLLGVLQELSHDTATNLQVSTDVATENAILPPDTSDQSNCVPSDFSHLRDVIQLKSLNISHKKEEILNDSVQNLNTYNILKSNATSSLMDKVNTSTSESSKLVQCDAISSTENFKKFDSEVRSRTVSMPTAKQVQSTLFPMCNKTSSKVSADIGLMLKKCDSITRHSKVEFKEIRWTREEDRILLQTCQKLGATEEAFVEVHKQIHSRNIEQVKNRFCELMQLFNDQQSDDDLESDPDDSD